MAVISKQKFDEIFGNLKCHQIIHPWNENCGKAYAMMFWSSVKGSCKFYVVFNLIKMILKYRKIKLNKKFLMEELKDFVYPVIFTASLASHFVLFSCLLRKVRGKFDYFGAVFVPGIFTGASIFLERSNKRSLFSHTFISQGLEIFIRQIEQTTNMKRTKYFDTVCFMFVNAYLLYLLREEYSKEAHYTQNHYYWFMNPPKLRTLINGDNKYCPHDQSCLRYGLKDPLLYFGVGCGIQIVKEFVNNFRKIWAKGGLIELKNIFNKKSTYTFGIFVGAYVGIYRLINCWLCRRNKQDKLQFSLLAGFASGIVYYIHSLLTFYMAAVAIIIQVHIARLKFKGVFPSHFPMNELLFMVLSGYLFHTRSFHADICPKFVVNGLSTCTQLRVDEMYQQFEQFLRELA